MAQSWVMGHALSGDDLPVLDLEHEAAAARVHDDEVGISRHGPDWSVAPAEVIVFQQLFQPLGEAPLAGPIELALRADREKARHLYLPW